MSGIAAVVERVLASMPCIAFESTIADEVRRLGHVQSLTRDPEIKLHRILIRESQSGLVLRFGGRKEVSAVE